MRNGRAARTSTRCDPDCPTPTASNRTRAGATSSGTATAPVTASAITGLAGSFVFSVSWSASGPDGVFAFSATVTVYSAPPRSGPPRSVSRTCTSNGPCGATASVIFQSRIRPLYSTFTACAAFAPGATVPNATAPGVTATSVLLTALTRTTAVETNFGPKVT